MTDKAQMGAQGTMGRGQSLLRDNHAVRAGSCFLFVFVFFSRC